MNSRICPSEEKLSEYLCGILSEEDRIEMEKHLAKCTGCRRLLAETHEIISKPDFGRIKEKIMKWVKNNYWFLGAVIAFICSFLFTRYFLQFLVACLLMGAKWIIDSRTTKMLIMIYEAWKRGDRETADKVLSRFDSKNL